MGNSARREAMSGQSSQLCLLYFPCITFPGLAGFTWIFLPPLHSACLEVFSLRQLFPATVLALSQTGVASGVSALHQNPFKLPQVSLCLRCSGSGQSAATCSQLHSEAWKWPLLVSKEASPPNSTVQGTVCKVLSHTNTFQKTSAYTGNRISKTIAFPHS